MIAIIGKGGFAHEVAAYIQSHAPLEEILFYEFDQITDAKYADRCLIAIGDPKTRMAIATAYPLLPYATYNAPSAQTYGATKGLGTIICQGAIVTCNVELGEHVHVNIHASIGHDSKIGSYTTISPGARISGNVTIGECCYIGSNAVIKEKVTICAGAIIGAGAVVVKDITEAGTYTGIPAKKIK